MLKSKIFSLLTAVLFVPVLVLVLSIKPTMAQDNSESTSIQLTSDEIDKLAQQIVDNDIDVDELEQLYMTLLKKASTVNRLRTDTIRRHWFEEPIAARK